MCAFQKKIQAFYFDLTTKKTQELISVEYEPAFSFLYVADT